MTRALAIVAALLIWEAMSRSGAVRIVLFPPPTHIFFRLALDIRSGLVFTDIFASLQRVIVGYALGCTAGIVLGVVTGLSETANLTVGQILQLARPIPPISIVPLVIVWIGIGEEAKCFLVAFGVLFPVWVSMHTGIRQVLPTHIWTAKSMGASSMMLVDTVYLPAATPFLFTGLRTALAIAFFCLVAAETTGATAGVMYRVDLSHTFGNDDRMLEGIMVLGILSASLDGVLMLALRRISPHTFVHEGHGLHDAD